MAGRINHRGWIVLESISSRDGRLCVDFFQDPAGGYGFEHFRADPEDGGRWTAIGAQGGNRYPSLLETTEAAAETIPWLTEENHAKQALTELR